MGVRQRAHIATTETSSESPAQMKNERIIGRDHSSPIGRHSKPLFARGTGPTNLEAPDPRTIWKKTFAFVRFWLLIIACLGSERSSAWLERQLWELDVAGSNPVAPTISIYDLRK